MLAVPDTHLLSIQSKPPILIVTGVPEPPRSRPNTVIWLPPCVTPWAGVTAVTTGPLYS